LRIPNHFAELRGVRIRSPPFDNGPQFISKDFKEFIRVSGMTHVRTSPHYLQSNGKIEHWHKSLKGECIQPGTLSLDDARRLVEGYVDH
jgi:transposase InsO family protein